MFPTLFNFFLKQFCLMLLIEVKDVFRKSKYHNGIHPAAAKLVKSNHKSFYYQFQFKI